MKIIIRVWGKLFIALVLFTISSPAQPPLPPFPPGISDGGGSGHSHGESAPGVPGGGSGSGTNDGGVTFSPPIYDTNAFYLEALQFGTNIYNADSNSLTLLLHNTIADVAYQIWSTTNLQGSNTVWVVEQNLIGSEITNFTPTTIPLTGDPQKYFKAMAYTLDSDGDGLPDWWENLYGLDPNNPDTGNTGIPDGYKQDSAGDGYNNLQKYQMGVAPGTWVTPQAPSGFSALLSTNGTSATLTWNASSGSVSNYTILVQDDQSGLGFVTLTNVSASLTTFTDAASTFSDGIQYQIQANYAGGSSTASGQSDPSISPSLSVNAKLIRGPYGRWQLAFSAIPQNVQSIQISFEFWDYWYDFSDGVSGTQTVAVSNLVNGCYTIPDNVITNYLGYNQWIQDAGGSTGFNSFQNFGPLDYGFIVFIQGVGTSGIPGPYVQGGVIAQDAPHFMDGRQELQESLSFLMEGAGITQTYTAVGQFPLQYFFSTQGTNFIEHSFIHPAATEKSTSSSTTYIAVDNTWPFVVDYLLAGWLYSTNSAPVFSWQPDFTTPSAVLTPNGPYQSGPYWISQVFRDLSSGLFEYTTDLSDLGGTVSSDGTTVSLSGGFNNFYGLPVEDGFAISVELSADPNFTNIVISPGSSATFYSDDFGDTYTFGDYYSQFQTPKLHTVDYYFAPINSPGMDVIGNSTPIQIYPLPLTSDFAVTNQTPLTIGAVGQPMLIGGWAKQAITNTASGKFAYLGQYFQTNAYLMSNGLMTTNVTGILSPYGEFFPTEPGQVALITMPDLITSQTGTDIVNVIKLQLDVNHDGTMDTSFVGPDNTSVNQPFVFWVNDDNDAPVGIDPGRLIGTDVDNPYAHDYTSSFIQSQRDLEDYARLWITGLPALASSNGYQVTLSWNVISGNPIIKLFNSVETNGGIGYLTDTNIAEAQMSQSFSDGQPGVKLATIAPGQPFTFPANFFTNNSTKYFLFEGAGFLPSGGTTTYNSSGGKGELVLTVSKNGTNIASTSAFIDLHNIEDLYERAQATNVTASLPPSTLVSQYNVLATVQNKPDESKQVIIHVHGINISDFQWKVERDTIFKRLYWSGYKGRFASFRWPCAYLPFENSFNPFNYNLGEFYAYKSANAFKNYLTYLRNRPDLSGYSIDILAHSQGNVITGEAIHQGAPFDNYILTQGAVPAHSYDTNAPFLAAMLEADTNRPTPFYPTNGGYHGYFADFSGGNLINFFNTNDFALVSGTYFGHQANWEADQETQKPEDFTYRLGQSYSYFPTSGRSFADYTLSDYEVTDLQEVRALVARSRSKAVGALGGLGGPIGGSIDLKASFEFDNTRDEHSAQITRPIQTVWQYYDQVMRSFQLQPITRQ